MLGVKLKEGPIAPLQLVRSICETPENVARNIDLTLNRGYVRFNEYLRAGTISVVGSGPSVARSYKDLTGDVMACNGAHDFLIERGITPRYTMLFDASPLMEKFITPNPSVLYFIASRCHASLFEKLKDNMVVVWHCKGDECLDEKLAEKNLREPMVHGGSAAALRAVFLVYAMGYRDVHLFGADSSCEETTHVGPELVPEKIIDVWAGRWFKTTAWMAGQVEDFKAMAPLLKERGMNLVVHGEGLLPCVAKAMGYEVLSTT